MSVIIGFTCVTWITGMGLLYTYRLFAAKRARKALAQWRVILSAEEFEYVPLEPGDRMIARLDRSVDVPELRQMGYSLVGDRAANPGSYAMRILVSPSKTTIAYAVAHAMTMDVRATVLETMTATGTIVTLRASNGGFAGPPGHKSRQLSPFSTSTRDLVEEHEKFVAENAEAGELVRVETLDDVLVQFRIARLRTAKWRNQQDDAELLERDVKSLMGDTYTEHRAKRVARAMTPAPPKAQLRVPRV